MFQEFALGKGRIRNEIHNSRYARLFISYLTRQAAAFSWGDATFGARAREDAGFVGDAALIFRQFRVIPCAEVQQDLILFFGDILGEDGLGYFVYVESQYVICIRAKRHSGRVGETFIGEGKPKRTKEL